MSDFIVSSSSIEPNDFPVRSDLYGNILKGYYDISGSILDCYGRKYAEAVGLTQSAAVPARRANPRGVSGRIANPNQPDLSTNDFDVFFDPDDGTIKIFDKSGYPQALNCGCCEDYITSFISQINRGDITFPTPSSKQAMLDLLTNSFFDIATQTCRWRKLTCDSNPDDIFKIVLNSTGSDGSIFSEDTGEDCTLTIDFDYLFKFDCESLTKLITTSGGIGSCSDVVNLLESLKATVVIDVIDPMQTGPSQLSTVFSKVIFPQIGQGKLYNYLSANGDFTGFYICGKLLNQQPNDNTCYPLNIYNQNINGSQLNCSTFADEIINKLYAQAGLDKNNAQDRKTFESNISENAFKSEWSRFTFEISDQNILKQIKNEKIKLSVQISGNCIDSCVYFDNIKLEKNCTKVERRNIFISKTPGFDLDRIIDNKKSWVEIDEKTRRTFYIANADNTGKIRYTDYYLFDSEQVINTKEIDLDINIASGIETDIWDFIYDNPCLLTGKTDTSTGATFPIVVKDRYGQDITLPLTAETDTNVLDYMCDTSIINNGYFFDTWWENLKKCFKYLSAIQLNTPLCYCQEPMTYECGDNYSIVKFRVEGGTGSGVELWVTCEKSGNTSQNRFYAVQDDGTTTTAIGNITDHIDPECIETFEEIRLMYLKDGYYTPNLLKKDSEGNCISCGCTCEGDKDFVDFSELFTLSLDTIDTLEDFKYYATSQLIDAKNRKTISSYPTLNLLYERYLNSNKYCTNLSSQFTYSKMDQFADLIGTYWVDLVEQVIPATTIWGATRIYSNTIFDSQKFQYKKNSLFFGKEDPTNPLPIFPSPTIGSTTCDNGGVSAITTTIQGRLTQGSPVAGWQNNTVYNRLYIVQYNVGSEFIGSVGVVGQGSTGSGQVPSTVFTCDIGVTISGKNPNISLSDGTATANVVGDVQQDDIKYLWNNGATGQTITNLSAGVYSVTVWDKDNPDCKAIDMITLIEV